MQIHEWENLQWNLIYILAKLASPTSFEWNKEVISISDIAIKYFDKTVLNL